MTRTPAAQAGCEAARGGYSIESATHLRSDKLLGRVVALSDLGGRLTLADDRTKVDCQEEGRDERLWRPLGSGDDADPDV